MLGHVNQDAEQRVRAPRALRYFPDDAVPRTELAAARCRENRARGHPHRHRRRQMRRVLDSFEPTERWLLVRVAEQHFGLLFEVHHLDETADGVRGVADSGYRHDTDRTEYRCEP